ncbi:uncharacterized protein LOC127714855 isoform X2 [Mytilus californianus]|nr:uncharacterized protein LOC127714855 isoform X2 [Mytilus californianus]
MCMKITKISNDVLYYYLLADTNSEADRERIYTPHPAPDVSTTPTCDYCQFTETIPDSDFRELRKLGTSETLTSTPSLCLPCEVTCEENTTLKASTLGPSSPLAVVTTMPSSTIQTTPEVSTPSILQSSTTEMLTTTKVTHESLKQATTNGAENACTFPSYLIGQWTDVTKGGNITFQTTPSKLTDWKVKVTGVNYDGQTCIHNNGNVYVFEGDDTFFDPFVNGIRKYYMCMKITKISNDVLYYYLLADKNSEADRERIYTPHPAPDISTTPTCDYCQFTETIPDSDFRELRKLGTSETLTSTPSLCLPCEATCEETTTLKASTLGPSSPLAVVTTMPSSTIQTTPEISTPSISQSSTTEILTTTKVTPEYLKQATTNGAENACTFPSYLIGQWTDVTKGGNITFQTTPSKLTDWKVKVTGVNYDGQTCIHNTGNVYVFEGDDTFFDPFVNGIRKYYMCMKITKISNDVLYYYLLADKNSEADRERIYTPHPAPDVSTTPTCNYCQFTQTIPDNDFRELRKTGTTETLTSTPVFCLPCEATCEKTTTSQKTTMIPSSSPITTTEEVTTKPSSLLQTTSELSTPTTSLSFTSDITTESTTEKASSLTIEKNPSQPATMDSKLQTGTTTKVRTTEASTTIKSTPKASVTKEKTSQESSKSTTNIDRSDATTTETMSTYFTTVTTSELVTTPDKVVTTSKDALTTTDGSILTTQQEIFKTTARPSGTGSIVDNNTEGLTESSILLITASSISGVLLGLAIITLCLCLIRHKTNIVKGHTAQRRLHHQRDRDYFNPL